MAGLVALGDDAPRGDRVTAAGGLGLAATHRVIEDAGLVINLDRPEAFCEAVVAFLGSV